MGNFLRKGKRKEHKKTKKHIKEFHKILGEMDIVASKILKDKVKDITEDNIEKIASSYTKRTIGSMEKMILMSKLKVIDGDNLSDRKG